VLAEREGFFIMGRLYEVLRQTPAPRRMEEADAAPACPEEMDAPATPAEEAIPFIEVGPRHLLEGSPDVLAVVPTRPLPARVVQETPAVRFLPFPHPDTAARHKSKFAAKLVAFHGPKQPEAQCYRDLLAAILRSPVLRCDRSTAVLFCPAHPELAVATIMLNLGITAAQQGKETIVVDGNTASPAVAAALGLPEVPGLREVLSGAAALSDALHTTEQEHLVALTAGLATSPPGARFIAATMRSLLRQLRERAEYVFIDGPAWERAEVLSLASAVEGVCLVLPESQAETAETDALFEAITQQGIRLAGCILAGA
jgi:Mrp family chromosome partitioning ATPase